MFQSSPGRLTGCNLTMVGVCSCVVPCSVSILTRSSDRMQPGGYLAVRVVLVSILTRSSDRLNLREMLDTIPQVRFNPHPVV